MEKTVALLKKRLQMRSYGSYDLLPDLFSESDLLQRKPGTIYFKLIALLEDDTVYINRKSFYSWLSRYRQKRKGSSDKTNLSSWETFKPTEVHNTDIKPDPILFEIVKPKKT